MREVPSLRCTVSNPVIQSWAALGVLLGLLAIITLQRVLVRFARFGPIAVMGLVVEDEDVLHAHQLRHHTPKHLALGLQSLELLARLAPQQFACALRDLKLFAQPKGVVVGDDDHRLLHVVQHVSWHQLARGVVAVGVAGLEDPQTVLHGKAWRDDENAAREHLAAGPPHGVDRLPGDQHGHHRGLARTRRQLERHALQVGPRAAVGLLQVVEDLAARHRVGSHLAEPDRRFHSLHLAEERADPAERMVAPVVEQTRRFRRHLPLRGWQIPPSLYVQAHLVDARG